MPATKSTVVDVMATLQSLSTATTLAGMARFGIPSNHALGVTVADMRTLAKELGRSHELAAALWDTGCYEARMVASMIDESAVVTPQQMDAWCRDFDNWAICDTVCFNLFNATPHAWSKIHEWSDRVAEFEKRAAFALLEAARVAERSRDLLFAVHPRNARTTRWSGRFCVDAGHGVWRREPRSGPRPGGV